MKYETKKNYKKITQNSLEKFHHSIISGHVIFALYQSSKVKPVNVITKSEFQKVTFSFLTQGIRAISV